MGTKGANFLFFFVVNGVFGSINITNSTSSMANYLLPLDEVPYRAGFQFSYMVRDPSIQIPTTNKTLLHISNSKFHDNKGGGVNFDFRVYQNVKYYVIIKNSSFERNVNPIGSGVIIRPMSVLSSIEVLMQDTNFTNHNMIPGQNSNIHISNRFTVITVNNLRRLQIINCTFAMNKQTALQALDSTLYFGGNVIFSGNNGTLGGALMLEGGSIFYLMPHTHVQIINNHAKRGGGIYVEDENTELPYPCFFQLMNEHDHYSEIDSVITLENNTADEAGSAVYGGKIDYCYLFSIARV